ncbi:hypothetical protein C9374_012652 [Naegleria lovaniensis]|uniref:Oxidoreductase n=1 Tax=Naegleria lovaniensis TaxID=51637 RepID=A0AA88H046_NAELO|nr:uncharacterized protein C9374_012652 [Naegleria lovaniensis]KAG2392400.1 hypothetical protein C9374_012652 [Naegleria lovaniensis]
MQPLHHRVDITSDDERNSSPSASEPMIDHFEDNDDVHIESSCNDIISEQGICTNDSTTNNCMNLDNNDDCHGNMFTNNRPINFNFQSHILNKSSRITDPLQVISKEELDTTVQLLHRLNQHRYLLKHSFLQPLLEIGTLVFQPLSDEEKIKRRKERRKQAKNKRREHDEKILLTTEMKKRKHKELDIIKEQLDQKMEHEHFMLKQTEEAISLVDISEEPLEKVRKTSRRLKMFSKAPPRSQIEELNSSLVNDTVNTGDSSSSLPEQHESHRSENVNNTQHQPQGAFTEPLFTKRLCYQCKKTFDHVHFFYHRMCQSCGDFNYKARIETCDLTGMIALITGGRVKIGYETSLKLLRNNAALVIVTTRFPKDAAKRYSQEPDFHTFKSRLQIYGLDLKHVPSVYAFTDFLKQKLPRLDIIINNAAQTIRRPCAYYRHVCNDELRISLDDLSEDVKQILPTDFHMSMSSIQHADAGIQMLLSPVSDELYALPDQNASVSNSQSFNDNPHQISINQNTSLSTIPITSLKALNDPHNISTSSIVSQIPLLEEDHTYDREAFPYSVLDINKSQVDLRKTNSWVQHLDDVPFYEFLEVQTINVTAPFILTSRLKSLMTKIPHTDKFIINVSSMEGQFYRRSKTTTHPHLNMAKASLNMMTRTSAADYAKDNIYMVSVDTGWNNDESPLDIENVKRTYFCPLDEIDGASRILYPIVACKKEGKKYFGVFLKNYEPYYW